MMAEEDVIRLLEGEQPDRNPAFIAPALIAPALDDAWAMVVAARTLLRDHPFEADKLACARRLESIAARQIDAATRDGIVPDGAVLFIEPLEGY